MRAATLRIGLFALAGLAALTVALVLAGGGWFGASERAQMRFQTSVYGLQPGAPVVLRGVRVGHIVEIGLAPAGADGAVELPVLAEFEVARLRELLGPQAPTRGSLVEALVARGLVARLATQSLLSGLLYVDLDFEPARPAPATAAPTAATALPGLPTIPTARTRLQTLQAQLEGLDLERIGKDLGAVAAATRQLLESQRLDRALDGTAQGAQAVRALAQAWTQEATPLARANARWHRRARRWPRPSRWRARRSLCCSRPAPPRPRPLPQPRR